MKTVAVGTRDLQNEMGHGGFPHDERRSVLALTRLGEEFAVAAW
jgi:hypothetical protein